MQSWTFSFKSVASFLSFPNKYPAMGRGVWGCLEDAQTALLGKSSRRHAFSLLIKIFGGRSFCLSNYLKSHKWERLSKARCPIRIADRESNPPAKAYFLPLSTPSSLFSCLSLTCFLLKLFQNLLICFFATFYMQILTWPLLAIVETKSFFKRMERHTEY